MSEAQRKCSKAETQRIIQESKGDKGIICKEIQEEEDVCKEGDTVAIKTTK